MRPYIIKPYQRLPRLENFLFWKFHYSRKCKPNQTTSGNALTACSKLPKLICFTALYVSDEHPVHSWPWTIFTVGLHQYLKQLKAGNATNQAMYYNETVWIRQIEDRQHNIARAVTCVSQAKNLSSQLWAADHILMQGLLCIPVITYAQISEHVLKVSTEFCLTANVLLRSLFPSLLLGIKALHEWTITLSKHQHRGCMKEYDFHMIRFQHPQLQEINSYLFK